SLFRAWAHELAQLVLEQVAELCGALVLVLVGAQGAGLIAADEALDGQGDLAVDWVDGDHLGLVVFAHIHHLARILDALVGQLTDVNETLDAIFDLGEGAELGQLGDLAVDDTPWREAGRQGLPGVWGELLDTQAEALVLDVDVEYDS